MEADIEAELAELEAEELALAAEEAALAAEEAKLAAAEARHAREERQKQERNRHSDAWSYEISGAGSAEINGVYSRQKDGARRNGARVYLAKDQGASAACTSHDEVEYSAWELLGRELSFTIDLSAAECGCNAAVYLVSMHANVEPGSCGGDFYCDDSSVCGVHCAEMCAPSRAHGPRRAHVFAIAPARASPSQRPARGESARPPRDRARH